jgi:formate hydrogenlyase subunit 6/NADH:ubiquinone oxidoreductase subunit I
MTYVITEPCIDVKDKGCIDECPVDCIYEGPGCSTSTPTNASTAAPANRSARSKRSSTKTTSRPMGPVHHRERQILRPARLPGRRRQTGPLPYDTDYITSYDTGR